MGSDIKMFRVDAQYAQEGFDFEAAKKEILQQFDEWREREKPTILAVNFGRKHGIYVEENPHYWYIQVLYY